ncbi:MAG: DUF4743 domain-containing protein [Alphaproteobacteria bacterium]|jgi:8-oxo-dGTP pyrophosphatase MutT (NUDIX family)|nr:DUF4743 domain-containing protein [Alphaproteobacteria bacterium]MDP6517870.1 DUF4743 domain-containing protein [Alphaproteobacteria bacterium]
MSFLDHIAACNACDLGNFVPFLAGDERVGRVRKDLVHHLADFPDEFVVAADRLALAPGLETPRARGRAVDRAARALSARGLTEPWRGEPYSVGTRFGETLFEIERAVVPFFGIRAYGIHMNGFVRDGDRLSVWIPRRPASQPTYPGKLDNTVAGGQPAGLGLVENLVKEAQEEAGLAPTITRRARPVGAISYRLEAPLGLRDDVIFVYDLELDPEIVPHNRDGELEDFQLWPADKVMDVVERTDAFKFNCNLVLIDFFVRHGLIGGEHRDYVDIVAGLHR